jgi:hypothetical protein
MITSIVRAGRIGFMLLSAIFGLCTILATEAAPLTICNPININYRFSGAPPTYREGADPCVVTFNNEYYLFVSHSGGYWWSDNFKDWNFVAPTGITELDNYAPSVWIIGNTMYFTAGSAGIYKTTDPKGGAWTYVSRPISWNDPGVFVDDDGKVYCYNGASPNGSINVVQLDPNNNFNVIGTNNPCFFSDPADHGFEIPGDTNASSGDTWIEGSWMTKYNGVYYLQYAVPGTQYRTYSDGAYESFSPLGPFVFCPNSPVTAKPLGFVTGTGHGCTFKDLNGMYWRADTVTISVNDIFERRLCVFPAGFDANGLLYSNTTLGDYPQYAPGQTVNSVAGNLAGWSLLSEGKTATASSQDTNGNFAPGNAFDENIRTWWCAATGNSGEWLSVDLGKNCTLNAIQPNFAEQDGTYSSERATVFSYKYKIEYSTNGTTWNMLVDKSANTNDYPHDYTDLGAAITARYVKITNLGTVPGYGKFAISDLRIFGSGGSALPGVTTSVTATRINDPRSATISWNSVSGAQGYVIRYGTASNKLYNNYEVWSGTSYPINSLNNGQDYYFTVDAFNDSGITHGTIVAYSPSPKSYGLIEAENYSSMSGVQTETCSEGGLDVGYIANGAYCAYQGFNFNSPAVSFHARVASASIGGRIEIHLDSLTGPLAGECIVPTTGGWQTWVTETCPITGITGQHTIYLKFVGENGTNLFNINNFQFFSGLKKYECEAGVLANGAAIGSNSAASGGAYVSNMHIANASCQINGVDGGLGGTKMLNIIYALNETSTLSIYVNGTLVQSPAFSTTGDWSAFTGNASLSVTLNPGAGNTITLVGGQGGINLDYITINANNPGYYYECEAGVLANGAITASNSAASGGAYVGNMHIANASCQINGINGGSGGTKLLNIIYALSETSTLSIYVNGTLVQSPTFPTTGDWSLFTGNVPLSITLNPGTGNTITLVGGHGGINLDYITTSDGTVATPQSGSVYHLVNQKSGMALDNSGSTSTGTAVTQWTDTTGDSNQEWKLVDVGNGYYNLLCQKSGMALDDNNSSTSGTSVIQWTQQSGNYNQMWQLVNLGGGQYNLICRGSGLALDNSGSTTTGTAVTQWPQQSGNTNQVWTLEFIR